MYYLFKPYLWHTDVNLAIWKFLHKWYIGVGYMY